MKALRARDRNYRGTREAVYPESDGMPMAETDVHRIVMNYIIEALDLRYEKEPRVYVSGNLFLYWEKGNPRKSVSPDVLVVKGVEKGRRRVYKTWEEKGRTPCVVIEVSSDDTKREDLGRKFLLYRDVLKVKEYYIYDPLLDYVPGRMRAWELRGGKYVPRLIAGGRVASRELGLELVDKEGVLRLVDPTTGKELPGLREAHAAMQEAAKARDAEAKARANAEKARADAEKARASAEKSRADAEKARADAVKAYDAEAKGRGAAEERARRLEEELARLRRKGGR